MGSLEILLFVSNVFGEGMYNHPRVYLRELETHDELRHVAHGFLSAPTIEEMIVRTFSYLQDKVLYVADPSNVELIRKPVDTFLHGGDCEDLTLLALEFFEELGIRSYFVMAPRHVFALVGPVDEIKLLRALPHGRIYNIQGYYLDGGFYVYFDPAVRNGYPGHIDLMYLDNVVIADVSTRNIVVTIGSGLEIRK